LPHSSRHSSSATVTAQNHVCHSHKHKRSPQQQKTRQRWPPSSPRVRPKSRWRRRT
jgi:hypothetical protein